MKPYRPFDLIPSYMKRLLEDKCSDSNSGWTPSELYQSSIIQAKAKSPEELASTFNISLVLAKYIKNLGN